jgi:hypothetical protein
MTLYIGVNIHVRQQTVGYRDERWDHRTIRPESKRDDIREFYSKLRTMVATGWMLFQPGCFNASSRTRSGANMIWIYPVHLGCCLDLV